LSGRELFEQGQSLIAAAGVHQQPGKIHDGLGIVRAALRGGSQGLLGQFCRINAAIR
jgi:hypothetical protein